MKLTPLPNKGIMPARPLCFGADECPTPGVLSCCNHRDECIASAFELRWHARIDARDALIKVLFRENAIHTESHNMLREIAVEIGEVTAQDHDTFQSDDRLEIQPTFELVCKTAEHFGQDGQCAACSPHGARPVMTSVDLEDGGFVGWDMAKGNDQTMVFYPYQEAFLVAMHHKQVISLPPRRVGRELRKTILTHATLMTLEPGQQFTLATPNGAVLLECVSNDIPDVEEG